MVSIVRTAAHAASRSLIDKGLNVTRSHLSEVIAALLGYRTYAAMVKESSLGPTGHHPLDDAELYVLNGPLALSRAADLLGPLVDAPDAVEACFDAIRATVAPLPVFVGVDDFHEAHVQPEVADALASDDDLAGVMAGSNASFSEDPDFELEPVLSGDLWAAPQEWTIRVSGELKGQYDPEGDRMYNGDTITFSALITYDKAGRAGLVKRDEEMGFGADDDSWRGEELPD